MLLLSIERDDQRTFLFLAELLCLADQPLLWGGKRRDEITAGTKIREVSIHCPDDRKLALTKLDRLVESATMKFFGGSTYVGDAERALLRRLEKLPMHASEDPGLRGEVALEVLKEALEGQPST